MCRIVSIMIFVFILLSISTVTAYESNYTYDANGNIKEVKRSDMTVVYRNDKNGNMLERNVSRNNLIKNGDFKFIDNYGNAIDWERIVDQRVVSSHEIRKIGLRNQQHIIASNMPVGSVIGISQAFNIVREDNKYFGMKSSMKIESLQNAEVLLTLKLLDNTGNVIEEKTEKSTLINGMFNTIGIGKKSIPIDTKKAVVQIIILSNGSNGGGSVTIRGIEADYSNEYYYNMLSNNNFQGNAIQNGTNIFPDYWEPSDNSNSSTISLKIIEGNKRLVVGRSSNGNKNIYVTQNIILNGTAKFQARGIFRREGQATSELRILFYDKNGTLKGTFGDSSISSTDITLSCGGKIPEGSVYAKVFIGAVFENENAIGSVSIRDIKFEYRYDRQVISNSDFSNFLPNSDIAYGWSKINQNGLIPLQVFSRGDNGKGQRITVPPGKMRKYGVSQKINAGNEDFSSKFLLSGNVSILSGNNAKLVVMVTMIPINGGLSRPYEQSYILTNETKKDISFHIEGNKKIGVAEAEISVYLEPKEMNLSLYWDASVVLNNLSYIAEYNPSDPVEMIAPKPEVEIK